MGLDDKTTVLHFTCDHKKTISKQSQIENIIYDINMCDSCFAIIEASMAGTVKNCDPKLLDQMRENTLNKVKPASLEKQYPAPELETVHFLSTKENPGSISIDKAPNGAVITAIQDNRISKIEFIRHDGLQIIIQLVNIFGFMPSDLGINVSVPKLPKLPKFLKRN